MIENGAWRLLWIPPALPYYEPAGAYADPVLRGLTKRLVFGSWTVVPKMLTCLLSYEAERRMIRMLETSPVNTLRCPAGPPPSSHVHPLAGTPHRNARAGHAVSEPSARQIRRSAGTRRAWRRPGVTGGGRWHGQRQPSPRELRQITAGAPTAGPEDEAWYWAAPILLDLRLDPAGTQQWLTQRSLPTLWTGGEQDEEEGSRWADHVTAAQQLATSPPALGRPPADLTEVLAEMAIGGPGTCALRALTRVAGSPAVGGERGRGRLRRLLPGRFGACSTSRRSRLSSGAQIAPSHTGGES